MRWKALDEIYKMHSFAPFSWDPSLSSIFCLKIAKNVANFLPTVAKFVNMLLEFVDFRADFYRNFTKSCRIKKIIRYLWKITETCENYLIKPNL